MTLDISVQRNSLGGVDSVVVRQTPEVEAEILAHDWRQYQHATDFKVVVAWWTNRRYWTVDGEWRYAIRLSHSDFAKPVFSHNFMSRIAPTRLYRPSLHPSVIDELGDNLDYILVGGDNYEVRVREIVDEQSWTIMKLRRS